MIPMYPQEEKINLDAEEQNILRKLPQEVREDVEKNVKQYIRQCGREWLKEEEYKAVG